MALSDCSSASEYHLLSDTDSEGESIKAKRSSSLQAASRRQEKLRKRSRSIPTVGAARSWTELPCHDEHRVSRTLSALPELEGTIGPSTMTAETLVRMMRVGDPRLIVLDVRDMDYFFMGKIPGCQHIAFETFAEVLPQLVYAVGRHNRIVFCSYDGRRRSISCAHRFFRAVRACFVKEDRCSVFYLQGGICEWISYCNRHQLGQGLAKASVSEAISAYSNVTVESLPLSSEYRAQACDESSSPSSSGTHTGWMDAESAVAVTAASTMDELPSISSTVGAVMPAQLQIMLAKGARVVDVRDLDFFMGHIPGAWHYPDSSFDDELTTLAKDSMGVPLDCHTRNNDNVQSVQTRAVVNCLRAD
ncbi:unnamed protein product [Effrenium voratum]|uniref:Rhodanese domain-containing protein n=1 Tax=Effrenium voratum TaxID=2562239 RepID=A0AA36J904_9DINO|nr:unnamed protein product [Effrenium voratum]CAJ1435234.1 unnamed protein product [Effrenium voratum]